MKNSNKIKFWFRLLKAFIFIVLVVTFGLFAREDGGYFLFGFILAMYLIELYYPKNKK